MAIGRRVRFVSEQRRPRVPEVQRAIELWIDVGLPDERELRKAAGRAREVKVYTYGGRGAALWWEQNRAALQRVGNLTIVDVPEDAVAALESMAERTMRFDCTIQEGALYFSGEAGTFHFEPRVLSTVR